MSRAELEAAAKEKYPAMRPDEEELTYPRSALREFQRAAYIQGRLDQAEADARIAEGRHDVGWEGNPIWTARYPDDGRRIAAAIRKGVE